MYLTLTGGEHADRIIAVNTNAARVAELHTHVHTDGMMRMQKLDAVDVPAKEDVVFRPHGLHIMLIDLTVSPEAGQRLTVTLTLERAGTITFDRLRAKRRQRRDFSLAGFRGPLVFRLLRLFLLP